MSSPKKTQQTITSRTRLIPIAGLLVLGMLMLVIRAVDLHVLQGERMQNKAYRQHVHDYTVAAPRGDILDRQQRILSRSIEVPSLAAVAGEVPKESYASLAQALKIPLNTLRHRLRGGRRFVWLKRQVSPQLAEQVMALKIRGVRQESEWQRYSPLGSEMGHVLGFVGVDGHGLEGVEYSFDALLQGKSGQRLVQRDARGHTLPGAIWLHEPKKGQTLALTMDSNIQSIAYAALVEGIRKQHAKSGSVVVMDPNNGDILAMASWPSFNPNRFSHYRPKQWRNRAITDVFEPGSSMKPFTMAAALDSGRWHVGNRIFCEHGNFQVADYTIHDDHSEGWLSLTGVIQRSSNIGAAKIALDIGAKRLGTKLHALGFGHRPNIALTGASAGILADPEQWGEVETANIAFGQGVAVTTLQLASAFATLAHQGQRVYPRLRLSEPVHLGAQVFTPSSVAAVKRMLVAATGREGTGFRAVPKGYQVAGKTGTAQRANHHGGYFKDKFTAVFAGFVPVKKPALVIVVEINEPKQSIYGGTVAAPVFRSIAATALPYLGVLSDHPAQLQVKPVVEQATVVGEGVMDFSGLSLREAHRLAHEHTWDLRMHGSGWVVRQKPEAGSALGQQKMIEVWLHE